MFNSFLIYSNYISNHIISKCVEKLPQELLHIITDFHSCSNCFSNQNLKKICNLCNATYKMCNNYFDCKFCIRLITLKKIRMGYLILTLNYFNYFYI
jgi:hypothetical protein